MAYNLDISADIYAGEASVLSKGPYDYTSVMHYGRDKFSRNGKDTIVTKVINIQLSSFTPALANTDCKLLLLICLAIKKDHKTHE